MMQPAHPDPLRVREVFEAALRLPPEERQGYVVAVCGADRVLAVGVGELLNAHAGAGAVLDTQTSSSDYSAIVPMEGRHIGPYLVAERIGAGGMGEVYKARDTRLDRTVALKLLPPRLTHDSQSRVRFEREARAVAALNHPHVCTLHDIGHCDGVDFLVMEYVQGETLHGPLPADEARQLGMQIASALAAVHRQGFLHRDIKPSNVMMTDSGAKLLDFGLAKLMGVEVDVTLTGAGMVVGTMAYMSPEQAQGHRLDARSDVFSFGAVLYEMVSGTRAFSGTSAPQVLSAILRDEPPPIWPPSPLEQVIRRCLAKPPAQRFQTMEEVEAALRHVDTSALKETPSIAVLPFASLSSDPDNEYFSDGVSEEIINALTQVVGLRVAARTSSFSFRDKALGAGEIAKQLNVRHLLEGSVRRSGNRVRVTAQLVDASNGFRVWSERYDRELADIFDVQDEIARAIVHRLKVALAISDEARLVKVTTKNMEAYQAYLKGRAMLYRRGPWIVGALESLEKAVALDQNYALAWAGLADAHTVMSYSGHRSPADAMPAALHAATRAVELDPRSAEAHNALACASLLGERDFERAEREFLEAIALNPTYIQARCWYGLFYLQWTFGKLDEGLTQVWRAFEADPLSSYVSMAVSFACGTLGRTDEALAFAKTAVEQDPASFVARWELSIAYHWNGLYDEALGVLEPLWAESPNTWATLRIVPTYAKVGRLQEARAIYDQMLARRTSEYVSPFALAACASALGDHEVAMGFCAAAVEGRDPLLALFPSWLPDLEPLRADPRFGGLAEQFNAQRRRPWSGSKV